MARELDGTTRGNIYACEPERITLVWPKKCKEMGPRDLDLESHPELHPYFAHDITEPLNPAHIEAMLMELPAPSKGRVGVIQPISVVILEKNEEGIFEAMMNRPGSWFVACDGRTRTREAREANKSLRKKGYDESEFIRVRFELKPVDGQGAVMIRDIAQRCRKVETPLDLAYKADNYIKSCTPKHLALQAMGLKSWVQVENYAALLTLDPKLQALVDANQMPMREALDIGRKMTQPEQKSLAAKLENQLQTKKEEVQTQETEPAKAPERSVRLTGRDIAAARSADSQQIQKAMTTRQIKKWVASLEHEKSDLASTVVAVLNTVMGAGDMSNHPEVAPPGMQPKSKRRRASREDDTSETSAA